MYECNVTFLSKISIKKFTEVKQDRFMFILMKDKYTTVNLSVSQSASEGETDKWVFEIEN